MNGFIVVSKQIIDTQRVSDRAKIIYLKLVDFSYTDPSCFPHLNTICERLGLDVSTVKRATKELREVGLIQVYRPNLLVGNTYVLIPVEWVDNLDPAKEFKPVPEEEQYIKTKEDFDRIVSAIKNFYLEQSRQMQEPTVRRRKGTTSRRTMDDNYRDLKLKISQGNYNFTPYELCIYFSMCCKEIRHVPYTIVAGRDTSIMKQIFTTNGISGQMALKYIKKFVSIYDYNFKTVQYPTPRISQMRVAFIFDKVKSLVEYDMEQARAHATSTEGESMTF